MDAIRFLNHISIHAPRTGSDRTRPAPGGACGISIHAPRTGSDWGAAPTVPAPFPISIHAPRTGSDFPPPCGTCGGRHFNPRSPYGERQPGNDGVANSINISIHAPRTGSDRCPTGDTGRKGISIHAPRTGSDSDADIEKLEADDFNPRSPYGERRGNQLRATAMGRFQSTLPVRGATRDDRSTASRHLYFNPRSPYGERQQKQPKSNAIFAPVKQFP